MVQLVGDSDNNTNSFKIIDDIVQMGHNLGLENLDPSDVRDAINVQAEDLTVEELIELDQSQQDENDEEDNDDVVVESQTRELSYSNVTKILQHFDEGCDMMAEMDPEFERSMTVRQGIQSATSIYREFLKKIRIEQEKRQKQKSMTDYFSKPK